ncbi:MAG: SDR family oxidoreductase [Gammaproteobacteria bacterium]|nr:SDR family oxidoreductase [Gammaproteobacteria bacterium]
MKPSETSIVIVGGSSGIGFACARRLAQMGYRVVITARTQARVDETLAKLAHDIAGQPLDYADRPGIAAAFARIGAFDHLVLAGAGPATWGAFESLDRDAVQAAFASKFWGYFDTLQAALPQLAKQGSITLVSGAAARVALPGTVGLAAVNGAIERMGVTLAKELAPRRVNVVSPGLVDTPAYDWMAPEARQAMLDGAAAKLRVQRYGTPDDIAQAVAFLMTNPYVTGSILDVDGGVRLG